ncbi:hypothetical protein Patl1_29659 [Pistacia atlantica]|uniref:Uncharacterized protein n=1 Tax=Pistacia atlantica TaxID=434234 RepID=A0ACC1AC59_9ROSI|nr:hypothetical protein Patl1_29659 [Pistacia atlantica]
MDTTPPLPPPTPPHPQPQSLNFDNLKALKVLGKGAMGTVFLVHDTTTDPSARSPFALKVADKLSLHAKHDADRRARWEILVLTRLSHPFLPKLIGSFETEDLLAWAVPYCPGGDLNVLRYRQNDRVFSPAVIRFYLSEIICALEYLHNMGIAYRDLKPENVLVQQSGHVTLTDFDLSRNLAKKTTVSTTTFEKGSHKGCWKKDPMKRLGYQRGACEIKEHVFFKGVRWDLLTDVLRPPFIPSREDGELTEKVTGVAEG